MRVRQNLSFVIRPLTSPSGRTTAVRDQRAARNLALLRKIAINLVERDRSTKARVRARRKKGRLGQ